MTRGKLMRLWELCADINGRGRRCRDETGKLPSVFFDFFGHCALIIVRVYETGWTAMADPDKRFEINTDSADDSAYNEAAQYLTRLLAKTVRRAKA